MRTLKCFVFFLLLFSSFIAKAQYRVDRLITVGRSALYYEDYVLSIQYFNLAISARPYLYEPWYYRSVAKYNLDDYTGAEKDVTQAIKLNPYIDDMYDLRAICRIRQKKYSDAITDYDHAIIIAPQNRNYWFNQSICRVNLKEYDQAQKELDTIVSKWNKFAQAYTLKAEVSLYQKDTVAAAGWLDKSLEIDPYNAEAWATRGEISLSKRQWRDADKFLSKSIHLKSNVANNYVNRALARINYNNLRGAMSDYDMAITIEPDNFLAHYNRALMRIELGDDNRAISDFDFIISKEPDNVMALYNRALLNDKTGNLKAAIRDYSAVIKVFPNFWTGLALRAQCYRRLGMTAKAELDEFKIFKAQMNKHNGVQPRWTRAKRNQLRKRSEVNLDKYNQYVVEDAPEHYEQYASQSRGKVQNRKVGMDLLPMFSITYIAPPADNLTTEQVFDRDVEKINTEENKNKKANKLYVTCSKSQIEEEQSVRLFNIIDSLTAEINKEKNTAVLGRLIFRRAIAYSVLNNYDEAISDLTTYLQIDSTSLLANAQRGVCQSMRNAFNSSQGVVTSLQQAGTLADFNIAIAKSPGKAYLYYNRGNMYASRKDYTKAIADYTTAIQKDNDLAEAYYNRGIVRLLSGDKENGIADLSKAGEFGLYDAYSIIKTQEKDK